MNNALTYLFSSHKRLNKVLSAGDGDGDVRAFAYRAVGG